jgi:cytidine deaminase
MTGAEIVAIISVSIAGATTLLSTCFHSRCTNIRTPCISCDRELIKNNNEESKEDNDVVIAKEVKTS